MTRVIVSADARQDADEILAYLEREAGRAVALRYAVRFRDLIRKLSDYPEIGARRPFLADSVRILVVSPYLAIYDYAPEPDAVTLLRILHGRRRITASMLRS